MPRVLAVRRDQPSEILTVYTIVIEEDNGNQIECWMEFKDISSEDNPELTLIRAPDRTYRVLADYEDPAPPPGRPYGGIYNELVMQIVKFITRYTSRDHHVELPYTITFPERPWKKR